VRCSEGVLFRGGIATKADVCCDVDCVVLFEGLLYVVC
jgi:hypothetical protein